LDEREPDAGMVDEAIDQSRIRGGNDFAGQPPQSPGEVHQAQVPGAAHDHLRLLDSRARKNGRIDVYVLQRIGLTNKVSYSGCVGSYFALHHRADEGGA